jgi:magnesium transporter
MEIFVYRKGAEKVEENFTEKDLPALLADETKVVWLDLRGETPAEVQQAKHILTNIFKFHYLTIDDCLETREEPKVDGFPDYVYFIVHGIKPQITTSVNFVTKELDVYLGKNFIVTFHAERFQSIKTVKQQIRASTFASQRGAAYLLHQILDQLIDLYMPVVEEFDDSINELEERVFRMKRDSTTILEEIMDLRRSVARLKRISARQLDVLYRLSHGEFPQIPENILPFYRDVHDHLLRISDLAESYRDLVGSLFNLHFSVTANKTNDIVKFLTIFSAVILPLSLIAGIFGMNTKLFPNDQAWENLIVIVLSMFLISAGLMVYFWRKGWIWEKKVEPEEEEKDIHKTVI